MNRWRIRPFIAQDLGAICRIHLSRFASLGTRRKALMSYGAKNLPGRCFVAVSPSGQVVGYANWTARKPRTLYCNWLAVAKPHSRSGIARALMAAVRRMARREGYRRVEVDTRNRFRAALPFYFAHGFDVVGVWRGKDRDLMIKLAWTPAARR